MTATTSTTRRSFRNALPQDQQRLYPSGYPGTVWYAVSNDEGRSWRERRKVLGLGRKGDFDSFGVFTPNILRFGGRYWLYYTGVRPTAGKGGVFENNSDNDRTAIGVAVSDSPSGPFTRVTRDPVLTVANEKMAFDSYRIDDACLVVREGNVWLYYKGRSAFHGQSGPGRTRMGVATADHPAGPFVKQNAGQPVQDSGHEVQVFTKGNSVLSVVSATGPNGRSLQIANDGLAFQVQLSELTDLPKAPGLVRPELTNGATSQELPSWGIAMGTYRGDPYLVRYECIWNK